MSEMKLVPVEPTEAMVEAGCAVDVFANCSVYGDRASVLRDCGVTPGIQALYRAMLSVAPVVSVGGLSGSLQASPSVPICAEDVARINRLRSLVENDECHWNLDGPAESDCVDVLVSDLRAVLALIHQAATPDGSGALRERLVAVVHRVLCDELGLHPDEAADSTGAFVEPLLAALPLPAAPEGGEEWDLSKDPAVSRRGDGFSLTEIEGDPR